jgi:hypothetical protein
MHAHMYQHTLKCAHAHLFLILFAGTTSMPCRLQPEHQAVAMVSSLVKQVAAAAAAGLRALSLRRISFVCCKSCDMCVNLLL